MKKSFCIFLSVICFMLSLGSFRGKNVHAAESIDTSNSIILYDKIFLGIGEEYLFDLQFEVDYYYITVIDSSVLSVLPRTHKVCGVLYFFKKTSKTPCKLTHFVL